MTEPAAVIVFVDYALGKLLGVECHDDRLIRSCRQIIRRLLVRGYTLDDVETVVRWARAEHDTGRNRWPMLLDLPHLCSEKFAAYLATARAATPPTSRERLIQTLRETLIALDVDPTEVAMLVQCLSTPRPTPPDPYLGSD
ncbi:MAG TPA: hypothetical protein VFE48_22395 [Methylomirabilota bacterium]|nr:hypothetical protein [Methylomirabilota bacterium]